MNNDILYLGMGHDVIRPMMLVPDFENMVAIDEIEGVWAEYTFNDIRNMITRSSDHGSWHHDLYKGGDHEYEPLTIPKTSNVKSRINRKKSTWTITFDMDGKKRTLTYLYGRDFHKEWPKEMGKFGHIMSMGAVFHMQQLQSLKNMMVHTCYPYIYYEGAYNIRKYPVVMRSIRGFRSEVVSTSIPNATRNYVDIKGTMEETAQEWQIIYVAEIMEKGIISKDDYMHPVHEDEWLQYPASVFTFNKEINHVDESKRSN